MFDNINNLLYKPKGSEEFVDDGKFVPYMVQRWASMHSPSIAVLLNETSNRIWSIMDSNQLWYQYFHAVIPKVRFRRIAYIKKKKEETKKVSNDANILKVAQHLEISSREVSQYVEAFNLLIPHEKKSAE
jgi:hypothetical protein